MQKLSYRFLFACAVFLPLLNLPERAFALPKGTKVVLTGIAHRSIDPCPHRCASSGAADVALILGGTTNSRIVSNTIEQNDPSKEANAGILLTDWDYESSLPNKVLPDFRGTVVLGNVVDCFENCSIGMQFGLVPWLDVPSAPGRLFTLGGVVENNYVLAYKQGINVAGAGTAEAPLVLRGNSVNRGSFGAARPNTLFPYCSSVPGGLRTSTACNISTSSSTVDRTGESTPCTQDSWYSCF